MKFQLYLLLILISIFSCKNAKNDTISDEEMSLIGKWKHTEAYISAGGPQYWNPVENGEEIEFFKNGIFSSTRFTDCTSGKFTLKDNQLVLEYDCEGFESQFKNENGLITFHLEFKQNDIILTPTSGPICIEGCSYKYEKIK